MLLRTQYDAILGGKRGEWIMPVRSVRELPQDRTPSGALEYRRPMQVCEIMVLSKTGWAVCPRCGVTMDRERMAFCDRCGQRLDWSAYKRAKIVYPAAGRPDQT